jgi:hypothetical protein
MVFMHVRRVVFSYMLWFNIFLSSSSVLNREFLGFYGYTPHICSCVPLLVFVSLMCFTRLPDILFFWYYVHISTSEVTDFCSGSSVISRGRDQTMYVLAERQANLSHQCTLCFPLLNRNLLLSNTKSVWWVQQNI